MINICVDSDIFVTHKRQQTHINGLRLHLLGLRRRRLLSVCLWKGWKRWIQIESNASMKRRWWRRWRWRNQVNNNNDNNATIWKQSMFGTINIHSNAITTTATTKTFGISFGRWRWRQLKPFVVHRHWHTHTQSNRFYDKNFQSNSVFLSFLCCWPCIPYSSSTDTMVS